MILVTVTTVYGDRFHVSLYELIARINGEQGLRFMRVYDKHGNQRFNPKEKGRLTRDPMLLHVQNIQQLPEEGESAKA